MAVVIRVLCLVQFGSVSWETWKYMTYATYTLEDFEKTPGKLVFFLLFWL